MKKRIFSTGDPVFVLRLSQVKEVACFTLWHKFLVLLKNGNSLQNGYFE